MKRSATRRQKEKERKNTAVLVIAIAAVIVAAGYILHVAQDNRAAKTAYNEIRERATLERAEGFSVDFDYLKSINPDVVAWIRIPGLDLSYPVMQTTDNTYYLSHTMERAERQSGGIFMDCKNSPDFSDMDTILYGHNMRNGTMFGILHRYEDEETWEENPYFIIYTPTGAYQYDIFSVWNMTGDTYKIYEDPCEEYAEYMEWHRSHSIYDTGVTVSETDRTVILSTCTAVDRAYRFIVCGKYAGAYTGG